MYVYRIVFEKNKNTLESNAFFEDFFNFLYVQRFFWQTVCTYVGIKNL